ncbi:MAG: glycoside hydrolase family 31 protein [Lachnospiraceae bacterium]|nr:glycoside hydrolase family 31 protein [Lachnospiraceae bacterium]
MKFECLTDEYWYGGCVKDGTKMPLTGFSDHTVDTRVNRTPNQAMPFFVSNKGRYIYKKEGFQATFAGGMIETDCDVYVSQAYGDLKRGYLKAVEKEFPFAGTPAPQLFQAPIYNTWIELTFHQNEQDILHYAMDLLEHRMPPGVIMIDDGWSEYYGNWRFHLGKFPDPEGMIKTLHQKGFQVMLWLCPFVTADTVAFRDALAKDILIKRADGETYIVRWWNGYSAVLDMSNPAAVSWLKEQLDALTKMGIDGFKFDAGDSFYYLEENVTFAGTTPNEQSACWSSFGKQYPYNEYRVTFGEAGAPLLQRLCDKQHSWTGEGVGGLIQDSLLQGMTGHPFSCPDMIGGGEYANFGEALKKGVDEELFIRHAQIAALMPAMQFSASPFRLLGEDSIRKVMDCVELRKKYTEKIRKLVEQAGKTGEPVIRYMAYEFPEDPAEEVIDQFMLGEDLLVAPIYEKGQTGREVFLPRGTWMRNGIPYTGRGEKIWAEQGDDPLILFEKSE